MFGGNGEKVQTDETGRGSGAPAFLAQPTLHHNGKNRSKAKNNDTILWAQLNAFQDEKPKHVYTRGMAVTIRGWAVTSSL